MTFIIIIHLFFLHFPSTTSTSPTSPLWTVKSSTIPSCLWHCMSISMAHYEGKNSTQS